MSEMEVFDVNNTFDEVSENELIGTNLESSGNHFALWRTDLLAFGAVVAGVMAMFSQLVMLIASGLPENLPASTFLSAQSTAELWRRVSLIHQPLCNTFGRQNFTDFF